MQNSELQQPFGASPITSSLVNSTSFTDDFDPHNNSPMITKTNNYLNSNAEIPMNSLIQLTSLNSQNTSSSWMLPLGKHHIHHHHKTNPALGKKNNSISDSSTADSDSGYMDDTRYESENEFFPADLEVSANCSNKRVFSGFAGRAKNSGRYG